MSIAKIPPEPARSWTVEDLLGREPMLVNRNTISTADSDAIPDEIGESLSGKVILVTGGGGSIGSELCRQVASYHPQKLIIFDVYENNAHAIGLELMDRYPGLDLELLIGSVRDSRRLEQVFGRYKPDVVYHAAAHKHVPLMEANPCEAIKNNVVGTYKTAYAALAHGCKRFVLISTDKAVNPTGIMGASKRICEMILQTFDRKLREGKAHELVPLCIHGSGAEDTASAILDGEGDHTEFAAVRFGNVLDSNGSVVPRFKEQIARGGPVTVTHPDVTRYFMTIPEAVALVLRAGTYADGGEIFVLDMGEPVKIDALARHMIRLAGLRPDEDIPIIYTGLRPGEKLYEERLMSEEDTCTTPNSAIHIGKPLPFDGDEFLHRLPRLAEAAYNGEEDTVRRLVGEMVVTYRPVNGANQPN